MGKVVGIDLGTTNSVVAYVKDGVPIVIRDSDGDGLVPSVVSVAADGAVVVGREAQRRLLTDAQRTAYSVKRFMGKGREDVEAEAGHFPFRIGGDPRGHLLELLAEMLHLVGMVARDFTTEGLLDFVGRGIRPQRQHVVEVLQRLF